MTVVQMIITICGFITALSAASAVIFKVIEKGIKKAFEPVNKKIDSLDKTQCQNYLIDFLADVDAGLPKDEAQWKHASAVYDHYTNDLKGNSYVHDKWESVKKKLGRS